MNTIEFAQNVKIYRERWSLFVRCSDFHETAQGVRFTVSESARREVLSRLLKLNHERWEEEQKVDESVESFKGAKKSKDGKVKKSKSTDESAPRLFE